MDTVREIWYNSIEVIDMPNFKNLTGEKFGRLNEKEVRTDCLTSGLVKSCGCLKKDQDKINLTKYHKHKLSHTKLWDTYYGMKSRCYDKTDKRYSDYGGRGIEICPEWLENFENFVSWSLKNGFDDNLQIDRIDNDSGYSPQNCRWISIKENCRNRRSNVMIEYQGKMITLVELSEILNIPYKTAYSKYRKYGVKRCDL